MAQWCIIVFGENIIGREVLGCLMSLSAGCPASTGMPKDSEDSLAVAVQSMFRGRNELGCRTIGFAGEAPD